MMSIPRILKRIAKPLKRTATIITAILAFAARIATTVLDAGVDQYPYIAVTTVEMISDIVCNVAGDKAEVDEVDRLRHRSPPVQAHA